MQIYLFAPLLILPFVYSERFGLFVAGGSLALTTFANFFTVLYKNFPPSNFDLGARMGAAGEKQ